MRTAYSKARLTRERICTAAVTVAERDGLDALSMRLLARELDASPMGLYRHVASKDDLLDAVVERLLGELRLPDESTPPELRLRLLAGEMRALAHRHPRLFELLMRRRAVGAEALRAREAVHRALLDAGLDAETAARRERFLSTAVMGLALSELAGRLGGEDGDAEFEEALDLLARTVAP